MIRSYRSCWESATKKTYSWLSGVPAILPKVETIRATLALPM
ncbi:Uncharacterised protein [Mycobacterium tuberculosis]|nr:Uncharacterised protein [Mycobacterium tuberculosis]CPA23625.1 Uncharacterised protein [Mycobacterium tuberculosis]